MKQIGTKVYKPKLKFVPEKSSDNVQDQLNGIRDAVNRFAGKFDKYEPLLEELSKIRESPDSVPTEQDMSQSPNPNQTPNSQVPALLQFLKPYISPEEKDPLTELALENLRANIEFTKTMQTVMTKKMLQGIGLGSEDVPR